MPLITQSLWAAPFCAIDHCSYTLLRYSTLLSAFLLVSISYACFATVTRPMSRPILAAAAVLFNPVLYCLSYTFMADVLFGALATLSLLLFMRDLERPSSGLFLAACVCMVVAALCRQMELYVPAAYFLTTLLRRNQPIRRIVLALVPLVVCVAALFAFDHWMRATGRTPARYNLKNEMMLQLVSNPIRLFGLTGERFLISLLYFGLFASPLLVLRESPLAQGWASRFRRSRLSIAGATTLLIVLDLAVRRTIMPTLPQQADIIVPQGFGPLTLRDTAVAVDLHHFPDLPSTFWVLVTLLSLAGAFRLTYLATGLVCRLVENFLSKSDDPRLRLATFALLGTLIYLAPLYMGGYFDRYLAPLVPTVCIFLLVCTEPTDNPGRLRPIAAWLIVVGFAAFAVMGAHDYLTWNRVRWQAIAELKRTGEVNPYDIDGGFEYGGVTSYDPNYIPPPGMPFWWLKNDAYLISFGPVRGWSTVLHVYPFHTYLPPRLHYIYVSKR